MDGRTKSEILVTVDSRLRKIIPKFLEGQRHQVSQVKEALKRRDFDELALIGHKTKGTCGGFGFPVLGEMGATLEKAAIAMDEQKVEQVIVDIEQHLSRITVQWR